MRLGLSPLSQHLFQFHIIDNPICNFCQLRKESTKHFFLHCPAFSFPRTKLLMSIIEKIPFQFISQINEDEIVHILLNGHDALPFSTNKNIFSSALEFIRETKRFNTCIADQW